MKIPVVYEHDGKSWGTSTPVCPGAFGQGRTQGAAKKSLVAAIRELVITNRMHGLPSPFAASSIKFKMEEIRV